MKKKQKDDILGEGQTDLPINEGGLEHVFELTATANSISSTRWLSQRRV